MVKYDEIKVIVIVINRWSIIKKIHCIGTYLSYIKSDNYNHSYLQIIFLITIVII